MSLPDRRQNMNDISFSIVIAARGRVALLEDLMKSVVTARTNYSGECEVLLIDSSPGAEKDEIRRLCDTYGFRYFYLDSPVSAKRNYGAQCSKNEVILFLDSDCVVTEHILERYAEEYSKRDVGAAGGPLEFVGPDTWFWKAIEATPYLTCFYLPKYVPTLEWGVTANFSVKREVFLEVGGFDESFLKPAGEDVDLGLMIRKAGYEIAGVPEALVYHSKSTWIPVKAMFRRLNYYGTADCDLIRKHPDKGETVLPKRSFLYVIYAILIAIAAAAFQKPSILVLIPGMIICENIIISVLVNSLSEEKKASLLQQITAQVLIHDSESAYLRRCVTTGRFKDMKRQMIYYMGQYRGMLQIGSYTAWVIYGCFGVIMFLLLMLL